MADDAFYTFVGDEPEGTLLSVGPASGGPTSGGPTSSGPGRPDRVLGRRIPVAQRVLLGLAFLATIGLFIAGDITPSVVIRYDALYAIPINKGVDKLMKEITNTLLNDPSIIEEALENPAVQATLLNDPTIDADITAYLVCGSDKECQKDAEKQLERDVGKYFDEHPDDLSVLLADPWVLDTFYPDRPYSDSDLIVLSSITAFQEARDSGAYGIAMAILVLSITWPYVKILVQMATWSAPLPEALREGVLIFLEQTGKLCIIEVLMLTLAMEGFVAEVNYNFPGTDVLMMRIKTTVYAKYGMLVYVIATTLTLLIGNFATIVQNWTLLTRPPLQSYIAPRESFCARRGTLLALGTAVLALAVAITMQLVPSFEFLYTGTMASSMNESKRTLSLSGAAVFLADEATAAGDEEDFPEEWRLPDNSPPDVAIWIFVYAVFLCCTPVLSALLGILACGASMLNGSANRSPLETRLAFATSTTAAWSCVEIFLLGALIMGNDLVELFEEELEKLVGEDTDDPVLIALTGGEEGDELLALNFRLLPGSAFLVVFWMLSLAMQMRTLHVLDVVHCNCGDSWMLRRKSTALLGNVETTDLSLAT